MQNCLAEGKKPHFMLMAASTVLSKEEVSPVPLIRPSFLRRQASVNLPLDRSNCMSLWEIDTLFRVKVLSASSINAADVDQVVKKLIINKFILINRVICSMWHKSMCNLQCKNVMEIRYCS